MNASHARVSRQPAERQQLCLLNRGKRGARAGKRGARVIAGHKGAYRGRLQRGLP